VDGVSGAKNEQHVTRGITLQQWRINVSFFAFILMGLTDSAVGILLPSVSAYYHLDKATVSLLFPVSSAGYLLAALASGPLLARLGRRVMLGLGGGVYALAALLISAQPPFALTLAAYFGVGFGIAILDAGLNAYIASLPRSVGLLNYLHAFYGVGALLGPVIASAILAAAWRWGATYLVWALLASIAAVSFALFFEPRKSVSHASESAENDPQGSSVFRAALRLPAAWICALFLFVYVGAEVSLGSWSYSLLTEERHIIALYAAWMVSGYWLGLTLGRATLARVGERLGSRRLIELCLGGVVAGALLVWIAPVGAVGALGLWLTGFSLGPLFPTIIAVLSEMVPLRLQQSAIGLAASLGSMGGAAFPFIVGHLAQGVGLWTLLPFVLALALLMVAIWTTLQRLTTPHG
jgi:fucose permease